MEEEKAYLRQPIKLRPAGPPPEATAQGNSAEATAGSVEALELYRDMLTAAPTLPVALPDSHATIRKLHRGLDTDQTGFVPVKKLQVALVGQLHWWRWLTVGCESTCDTLLLMHRAN